MSRGPVALPVLGAFLSLGAFGIYATTDMMVKVLGEGGLTPMQVMFCAGAASVPFILIQARMTEGGISLRPSLPLYTIARVVLILAGSLLVSYTFAHIPIAEVYSIFFCMPLLITALAWPLLGEALDLRRGLAILVGFAGVLIALRPTPDSLHLAHLVGFLAATIGAVNSLLLRKIGGREKASIMLLYPAAAQMLILGSVMPIYWVPMPASFYAVALGIGVLSTVAGVMIIAAYSRARAAVVAPMQYSQIIWGASYGALFFGEVMDAMAAFGIGVIIAAGLYILWLTNAEAEKAKGPKSAVSP